MECFARPGNTKPFGCPELECPDITTIPASCAVGGSSCFWDESLFDCLHDLSTQSHTSHNGGLQVAAAYADDDVNATSVSRSAPRSSYPSNRQSDGYLHDFPDNITPDSYEDEGYGDHAALTYGDIEDAGHPSRPQDFPTPFIHDGTRTTIRAMDHRTGLLREVKHVLMAASNVVDSSSSLLTRNRHPKSNHNHRFPRQSYTPIEKRAYLMKKKISKSQYGNEYLAVVLKRREISNRSIDSDENERKQSEYDGDVEWESTEEFVIVTVSPWSMAMRTHRSSLGHKREGILRSVAAQQHIGSYHPHVQGLLAVFQDEERLYTVTKFHGGTDLQSTIVAGRDQGAYVPNEAKARGIFSQLLQGVFHLQRKGVYHSNLSLQNVYVNAATNQNLVIADLGRCIRVPYNDPSNFGCIIGEAEGTTRRLLQLVPQDFQNHPSENLMYLPPEVLENEHAFDGFAADLWASGCILFVLLVGMAPFKTAHYWDTAYAEISSGNLKGLLQSLNICLSDEATGLLQIMFWRDPKGRLSLSQIMDHPWVKNERFPPPRRSSTNASTTGHQDLRRSHVSSAETSSTTSSFATEKANDQIRRRSSSKSRKSLSKTITSMFGGGAGSCGRSGMDSSSGSITKAFNGFMNGASSHKTRRSSVGGPSSQASSVTTGSPATPKIMVNEADNSGYSVQVLRIPDL